MALERDEKIAKAAWTALKKMLPMRRLCPVTAVRSARVIPASLTALNVLLARSAVSSWMK